MKPYLSLSAAFALILLSACAPREAAQAPADIFHLTDLSDSDIQEITHNIDGGTMPVGIGSSPQWVLPEEVNPAQFKNAYRLYESVFFGVVLQPNSNIFLPDEDGKQFKGPIQFAGLIFTRDDGKTWRKSFEIKNTLTDEGGPIRLNPVGLFWNDGRYYLDLADDRGAGSGEGNLIRYWTTNGRDWTRDEECHYFNPDTYYNEDPYEFPVTICPDYLNKLANDPCLIADIPEGWHCYTQSEFALLLPNDFTSIGTGDAGNFVSSDGKQFINSDYYKATDPLIIEGKYKEYLERGYENLCTQTESCPKLVSHEYVTLNGKRFIKYMQELLGGSIGDPGDPYNIYHYAAVIGDYWVDLRTPDKDIVSPRTGQGDPVLTQRVDEVFFRQIAASLQST